MSFLLQTPKPIFSDFYKLPFVTKLDLSIVIPVSYWKISLRRWLLGGQVNSV